MCGNASKCQDKEMMMDLSDQELEALASRVELEGLIAPTREELKAGDNKKDLWLLAELLWPPRGTTIVCCMKNTDKALLLVPRKYQLVLVLDHYANIPEHYTCKLRESKDGGGASLTWEGRAEYPTHAIIAALVRSKRRG